MGEITMMTKKRTQPIMLQRAREMRKEPTKPEATLWQRLRRKQLNGYKFRRQHVMGRFIVDFYCHEKRLIIEVDGDSHLHQREYDAIRTAWLESQGNRVIRFWNSEVTQNMDGVLTKILQCCEE